MNIRLYYNTAIVAFIVLVGATAISQEKGKVKKQTIKAVEGLRFDPVRFSAKKGETIELKFENTDPNDQPHNFVFIRKGTLKEIQEASMAVGPDSAESGFVPKSDAILAKTGLLTAGQNETITMTVPEEKGIYHYVCTFPGHAIVMYGALYVDTKIPDNLALDTNVPEIVRAAELEKLKAGSASDRPSMVRAFMPDAGPAAIAVALPGDLSYCWDAGNCRLRYGWKGAFIDATKMWNSNGNSLVKLLGDKFWESHKGETVYGVQIGDSSTESVSFKGYKMADGLPVFSYEVDGVPVQESITAGEPSQLKWHFEIKDPKGDVRLLAPESDGATISSTTGKRDGDHWVIPQSAASEFTLTITLK